YVIVNDIEQNIKILYQAMYLKKPKKFEEAVSEDAYYKLSQYVLAEYAGDYIILSCGEDTDMSFTESNVWQSIPAVQNGNVIEIDTAATSYSDPTTLEYLLEIYSEGLSKYKNAFRYQ